MHFNKLELKAFLFRGVGRMGGWLVVLVGSLMCIRVDTVNPLEGGMAQRLLSQRDELVQVKFNFCIWLCTSFFIRKLL